MAAVQRKSGKLQKEIQTVMMVNDYGWTIQVAEEYRCTRHYTKKTRSHLNQLVHSVR